MSKKYRVIISSSTAVWSPRIIRVNMDGASDMKVGNDSKPRRIFCVDFLRGFDIFYLAAIHYALLSPGVFRV